MRSISKTLILVCTCIGTLSACGGGGSSAVSPPITPISSAPPPAPDPVPMSGPSAPRLTATASQPSWLNSAVIYNAYTEIFSTGGNFAGVTAQLPRLHALGINVLWLMPICPLGQAINGHPSYGSPYAISDHTSINPKYGTSSELATLVQTAHGLGIKVIIDMPLNHTSWDNPLISIHPEYYVHSDSDPFKVSSIQQAFNFADVAQLNYKWSVNGTLQNGLQQYMVSMLQNWITKYDIDGFRFDMPDNPGNSGRMIPASFWQALRPQLEAIKPSILMLGEEQNKDLTTTPFELDYGWQLQSVLAQAATTGNPSSLRAAWQGQITGWPIGSMHMTILQNWDLAQDFQLYGGNSGTMAAAVFNFTIDGVPLLWNGEEVGNNNSGNNTHNVINWSGSNAAQFTQFYTSLIAVRNANTALQQGSLTWVTTTLANQVIAYDRSDINAEFLIEINFSGTQANGSLSNLPAGAATWTEVTPAGAPGGVNHTALPYFKLAPYDFAIFKRNAN